MSERIVSPGVFTNEIDQSFLPAAVSNIGAALIGICNKGPAFVPTLVDSYQDFKLKFGGLDPNNFLPYAAKSYLKNAGTCTVVRVLGSNGYTATDAVVIKNTGVGGVYSTGSIQFEDAIASGDHFILTGSDNVPVRFVAFDKVKIDDGDVVDSSTIRYFESGSGGAVTVTNLAASASKAINNAPSNISSFYTATSEAGALQISGSSTGVSQNGYIIDDQGGTGFTADINASGNKVMGGGVSPTNESVHAVIFPTASAGDLTLTVIDGSTNKNDGFKLSWHGNNDSPEMSLNVSDGNYILDVLGSGVQGASQPGYVHKIFPHTADKLAASTVLTIGLVDNTFGAFSSAKTPYIISQTGSVATDYTNLFRFETMSHGNSSNQEIKIGISNIKKAGSIAGSDYGSFDVVVRKFSDTDKRQEALESFAGCNLDPNSSNYVVRRIGDIKQSFSSTTKKITVTGDYDNKSKYIRISDVDSSVNNGNASVNLVPWGFGTYSHPFNAVGGDLQSTMPIRLNQTGSDSQYNNKLYHGLAFDSGSTAANGYSKDILTWLSPIPSTVQADMTSSIFRLDQVGLSLDSTLGTKKFILGFQGGFDGYDETFVGGTDGLYYGLGKAQTSDSGSFTDAIAAVSNPDELDINMLVLPGINKKTHGTVHSSARDTIEDRADTFYVFDAGDYSSDLNDWISQIETEDSNYSSTYYPWVKIFDEENNKHVYVPPSVVIPGVIAFTDKISHPWYAPAGLNRGGLTEVIMAKDRLTHDDRDTLYESRVNPIATFPGEGVVVWGQKTLQAKPSALDRVNVRRLLIKIKKFIASSSRYLVFEQNTQATRQRFLNIVNPYLEQVQSNSGVSAFRVVMDDTNNTPDVVDRNELRGAIYVQPTRTAEFIVLDFVVQPTGAAFQD